MLTKLIILVISLHIHTSNHVVHLTLTQCYVNYISVKVKKKETWLLFPPKISNASLHTDNAQEAKAISSLTTVMADSSVRCTM